MFYVYFDQPSEINVYSEYNKNSDDLKRTDENAQILIDCQIDNYLLSYITVNETKLNKRNEV